MRALWAVLLAAGLWGSGQAQEEPRVINGSPTTDCSYQARLSIRIGSSGALCGGVILSASYVVTAGHCCNIAVTGQSVPSTFTVTAGTCSLTSGGTSLTADKAYIHPQFDGSDYAVAQGYDICVLHLSSPFSLGSTIAAIPLSTSNPAAGATVRLTGWGSTNAYASGQASNTQLAQTLQEAFLTVLSEATVDSWFTAQGGDFGCNAAADVASTYNYDRIVPTGNAANPVYDACQGDSGGPIALMVGSAYQLVGVVSHGYGCGQPSIPSFQTSTVGNLAWIQSVMAGSVSDCNGWTCGPGATCSSGTCTCASGFSPAISASISNFGGYSCKRWLNGGTVQAQAGYNVLYQLVPTSSPWDSTIIRGFGSPPVVSDRVTSCGYNYYSRSSTEASAVVTQLQTYLNSAGLGQPPNSAIWNSVQATASSTLAYFSASSYVALVNTFWAPGQPTTAGCALMPVSGSTSGEWITASCSSQTWYIIRYATTGSVDQTGNSGSSGTTTTNGAHRLTPATTTAALLCGVLLYIELIAS